MSWIRQCPWFTERACLAFVDRELPARWKLANAYADTLIHDR